MGRTGRVPKERQMSLHLGAAPNEVAISLKYVNEETVVKSVENMEYLERET